LILYTLACAIFFLFLPLVVIDFGQLIKLYQSWFHLLVADQPPTLFGYSVFGWLESWFHMHIQNIVILTVGALLFLLPFTRLKMYASFDFRLHALSSILIWVVIFNHMAESPTFIIAMAGVAIWFFTSKPTFLNIILFVMAIILTSLSSSDIFPRGIRNDFIQPYVLKAFPCILIWIKIVIDMMNAKKDVESSAILQPANLNAG